MNIPIKTIDTDGVLPSKRIIDTVIFTENDNYRMERNTGFNTCVTHNETLTIEMDAEKMAENMYSYMRWELSWKDASNYCRERYLRQAENLLSNPDAWMKLGVKGG